MPFFKFNKTQRIFIFIPTTYKEKLDSTIKKIIHIIFLESNMSPICIEEEETRSNKYIKIKIRVMRKDFLKVQGVVRKIFNSKIKKAKLHLN